MVKTYNALEGDLSVRGAATATRTGEANAVAIVGGYDAQNASSDVTAGEPTYVDNPTSAEDTFGASELSRASAVAAANGVGTIHGVPVPETESTESVSSASSMTLSNTPLFDPLVHPDHEITVVDTDTSTELDVYVEYDDGDGDDGTLYVTDTTTVKGTYEVVDDLPSDAAAVDPIRGNVDFDASGNYEVTYTYGDYETAIETAVDLPVRYVVCLTEAASVKATLVTALNDIAQDFDFKRGVVSALPDIETDAISDYTPNQQDWRLVEVAPARATGADGGVRTAAAVGGYLASQPLGPDGSVLYDDVGGLTSLNSEYRPSDVKSFDGVTALTRTGRVGTAETTSTEGQFRNIYATEIIDAVASSLFDVARDYAGGPQDVGDLEATLGVVCQRASRGNPPLLGFGDDSEDRPYDVSVSLGASNSEAQAGVTIVPSPIAEKVNLDMTVSDGFVQFGGASA